MISASPSLGLFGAFAFGALGSLTHCVFMCGPLAAATAGNTDGRNRRRVAYHSGRILTYSMIGALVGATGSLVNFLGGNSDAFREGAALLAGILLIISGLALFLTGTGWLDKFAPAAPITRVAAKLMKKRGFGATFLLGLVLGLLPCGLVYTAASYALAAADPVQGSLTMAAFGLGTIPALVAADWGVSRLRDKARWFRFLAAAVLTASGTVYLVRSILSGS